LPTMASTTTSINTPKIILMAHSHSIVAGGLDETS
jgi:hypothetical protein